MPSLWLAPGLFAPRLLAPWLLALGASLGGCSGQPKNFENDNDALRRRVAELEGERDAALARATEAEAKLGEAANAAESRLDGQVLEALPRCAGVTIDRFSGLVDSDDDGRPDSVDVYIKPYDGRQRFVQVPGRLTVEATILAPAPAPAKGSKKGAPPTPPPGPAPTPLVVGPRTLSPVELREAYRSSMLGTHYLATLDLPQGAEAPEGSSVVIRVELLDPTTGVVHRAERLVSR